MHRNILPCLKHIALIWDKVKGLASVTLLLHEFMQPVQSLYAFLMRVTEWQVVSIVPMEDAICLAHIKLVVLVLLQ